MLKIYPYLVKPITRNSPNNISMTTIKLISNLNTVYLLIKSLNNGQEPDNVEMNAKNYFIYLS